MPMIPKPMTDINSESAYEKLKFIPEHYNEIMAAYTDIMEHLKLPVMTDTGGGGSGEDCLHEVVEVTNPCPAYVQFDLNALSTDVGFYYTYKDNFGDYSTSYVTIANSNNNSIGACIVDALHKYNREHSNDTINLNKYSSDRLEIFSKPTNEHSDLDYTVILLDKTTGKPVENMDLDYTFDGYEEVTYDIVSEMYDIKLALTEEGSYAYEPIILGDFYEKLVELRNSINTSNPLSKLPTPEEFGRLLNVSIVYEKAEDGASVDTGCTPKVNIKLLTEEERTEVRKYIEMNASSNVPPDTPYMYALDIFCHPDTISRMIGVSGSIIGSYSKGYTYIMDSFSFGRSIGCGDPEDVTYIHSTISLTPSKFSSLYTYFVQNTHSDQSKGAVVMPQTFKLIQSKEGIDRRL